MIFGIGIDIVQMGRIEKAYIKFADEFANKILTADEFKKFTQSQQKIRFLAKHFAAKEAIVKAMGTGFKKGIYPQQFTVKKYEQGRPYIECSGKAKQFLEAKKIYGIHLSLSDEIDYAAAIVVLESQ